MPIKFLLLGVLEFLRRGGGSANFIFMGVGVESMLTRCQIDPEEGRARRI